jgi:mannose-6-phosphate isomerase
MDQLYPLKFKPILKERIWGGNKLKTSLRKTGKCDKCGESWELSAVQGDVSVIANGFLKNNTLEEIVEIYMGDLVGDKVFEQFGIEFPLLIKFIDANDNLSIQVHPNDDLALKRHNSYGKTEMWYVMDATPGANLISGFSKPLHKEEYLRKLNDHSIEDILNKVPVQSGDAFFIPAGRVHAIGAGILLAEIQQTSDVTYRIFDYNRTDSKGKTRELHTDLAVDAIDYSYVSNVKSVYHNSDNIPVPIVSCPYFTTNRLNISSRIDRDYIRFDSFVIYICCKGKFDIIYNETEKIQVEKGETILLPAAIVEVTLVPSEYTELLEIYIE